MLAATVAAGSKWMPFYKIFERKIAVYCVGRVFFVCVWALAQTISITNGRITKREESQQQQQQPGTIKITSTTTKHVSQTRHVMSRKIDLSH